VNEDTKEQLLTGVVIVLVIVGLVVVTVGSMRLANEASFPASIAKIEQLRSDAAKVNIASNEDVVGQITQHNQAIREAQAYRTLWYGRLFTPDRWEGVKTIEIPQ